MLNPDMHAAELRLHMGEMNEDDLYLVRSAIRWANAEASREVSGLQARLAAIKDAWEDDQYYCDMSDRVYIDGHDAGKIDFYLAGPAPLAVVEGCAYPVALHDEARTMKVDCSFVLADSGSSVDDIQVIVVVLPANNETEKQSG